MIFKEDKGTGYMYCYNPDHYTANKAGKVLEHVFIMSEAIGRKLKQDECVHHIDRNKKNNDLKNLQLLTISEHTKLHQKEDNGAVINILTCLICGIKFNSYKDTAKYCSCSCSHKASEKFEITKEDLEYLVWSYPTTEVAKILGVSDVAVSKRCKKLSISKPPRGYWAKIKAGKNIDSLS
jgi:hypothetical protein